jgi:hypothetical protein
MDAFVKYIKRSLRELKSFYVRKIIKKQLKDDFVANDFGFNRGLPVDRFYIDKFFTENSSLVMGKCLEFGDTSYIVKYGKRVSKKVTFNYCDVSSMSDDKLLGDISDIDSLPSGSFDCILCVNVLNFIYDTPSALLGLKKLLSRSGRIMLTVAGPSAHISRYDMDRWGDYWRMTDKALIKLAQDAGFIVEKSETFGNPYSCSAQLNGLSVEDLIEEKIRPTHPDYQLIIAVVLSKKEKI